MIIIDDNFKSEIGKRLRFLRNQNGLTIDELVSILNNKYYICIDEKSIRRYEKGVFLPKIDNLIALSDIFNTTLDYLIFGKETSDNNSYTWKDSFMRINRLVYSCVLFPFKDDAGKYYYVGYDDELQIYTDKLIKFAIDKNFLFEKYNKNPHFDIHCFDDLINDFNECNEELFPTKKRLDQLLIKSGIDHNEYLKDRIQTIRKKREI